MTSHILLDEDSEHGLRCLHCYDIHSPVLPMTVERHIDECRGFVLMHKHCVKPKEPSPQLPLPHTEATHGICTHTGIGMPGCEMCDPRHIDPPNGYADTERERPEPPVDRFAEMYPQACTGADLFTELRALLPDTDAKVLGDAVWKWHPQSGIFDAVAHWARLEKAHAEAPKRAPIAGLYIPARLPMPEALAEVLGVKGKKRGARPLSSGKARKGKAT